MYNLQSCKQDVVYFYWWFSSSSFFEILFDTLHASWSINVSNKCGEYALWYIKVIQISNKFDDNGETALNNTKGFSWHKDQIRSNNIWLDKFIIALNFFIQQIYFMLNIGFGAISILKTWTYWNSSSQIYIFRKLNQLF